MFKCLRVKMFGKMKFYFLKAEIGKTNWRKPGGWNKSSRLKFIYPNRSSADQKSERFCQSGPENQ